MALSFWTQPVPVVFRHRRRLQDGGLSSLTACFGLTIGLGFLTNAACAQQTATRTPPPPLPLATPATPQAKTDPGDDIPLPIPTVTASKWTLPPSTAERRPDLFAPIPLYSHRDNLFINGAADLRYRSLTDNTTKSADKRSATDGSYIAASRLTLDYVRANPQTGDERGGMRFQLVAENDNTGTSLNRLRPSETYLYYRFRFPGVSASVRGGQFVLPFGLIAVYDTPLQPIQTLYEKSLGLRVDRGVLLEGDYGPYHYAGSVTTGSGPNRSDPDSNKVVAFRLARTLRTKTGRFQVGGSLLTGRLPKTDFSTELPPSGAVLPQFVVQADGTQVVNSVQYVNKTRFAGDGEYVRGALTARGEIVFGGDDDSQTQSSVWGYFAEGDYQFRPRLSAVAFTRRWNFPIKPQTATTLGTGLNYDVGQGAAVRLLFEFERDVPTLDVSSNPTILRRITLQTRLNF